MSLNAREAPVEGWGSDEEHESDLHARSSGRSEGQPQGLPEGQEQVGSELKAYAGKRSNEWTYMYILIAYT